MHRILPERHVDAGVGEFLDTRDATALGEGVLPTLQVEVFGRGAREVDVRGLEQLGQVEEVRVVGRPQGTCMARGGAGADARTVGERAEQFHIA